MAQSPESVSLCCRALIDARIGVIAGMLNRFKHVADMAPMAIGVKGSLNRFTGLVDEV
ncbi:MAG: hypothetical protein ACFE0R_13115 [Salinarimonas sp.]